MSTSHTGLCAAARPSEQGSYPLTVAWSEAHLKVNGICSAGLPSMISEAAHSVSSNMSSNLGDLLGLSEEKPHPAPASAAPQQHSSGAAAQRREANAEGTSASISPSTEVVESPQAPPQISLSDSLDESRDQLISQSFCLDVCPHAESTSTGPEATGEYIAALSSAASYSTGDATGLVKRLNTQALDPAQLPGVSQRAEYGASSHLPM